MRPWARLIQSLVMLCLLSFGLFALVHGTPGSADELRLLADPRADVAEIERLRAHHGLDLPLGLRYRCWLLGDGHSGCERWPSGGVLRGELGQSRRHGVSVQSLLVDRTLKTLALTLPALLLAVGAALGFGAWTAATPRSPRKVAEVLAAISLSMPTHWLGLLAIAVFALGLGWLPASGADSLVSPGPTRRVEHLVLPVLVLAFHQFGLFFRHARSALEEVLRSDFIRSAKARGVGPVRILGFHASVATLPVLINVVAQSLPGLFSGALVVESVFAYPGMGRLIFQSLVEDDHMVAVITLLGLAALTFAASLLADAVSWLVDPRRLP